MKTKEEIIEMFKILSFEESSGIEGFLSKNGKDQVFKRLEDIENNHLSEVQLNQLFVISGLHGFSFDFYNYYWLQNPSNGKGEAHPYDVKTIEGYDDEFTKVGEKITSLEQLKWGLYRLYVDSLLYFGDINKGFEYLSNLKEKEIIDFFSSKCYKIRDRGESLEFENINKDDRYLISEMACKTYEVNYNDFRSDLVSNYRNAIKSGLKFPKTKDLINGKYANKTNDTAARLFSAEEFLEETIKSEADIETHCSKIYDKFIEAHKKALQNTEYYLSLVNDLDVYVATSMRNRDDFIKMANNTERIFKDAKVKSLHLRYFDPTISAARCHEDKGLIECLMVKCAKVLIYTAGDKESYGKDVEAAMALSSGKPVIFFCPDVQKKEFYAKVHPLTRLVDFNTGIVNGAMVTFDEQMVVNLLDRIFKNKIEYELKQSNGYFKLEDKLSGCTIRIQTSHDLLKKSFWNYYNKKILRK